MGINKNTIALIIKKKKIKLILEMFAELNLLIKESMSTWMENIEDFESDSSLFFEKKIKKFKK